MLYGLDEHTLEELHSGITSNVRRYRGEGFGDLVPERGWSIPVEVEADLDALSKLDGTEGGAASDLINSKIVRDALGGLSPALANENRIWTRLSHVECFHYSAQRWSDSDADPEAYAKAIELHFFAGRQTQVRDDHAVSRLWWNGFIAKRCFSDDPDRGLELLLSSADVRSQLVERVWLISRPCLAQGVFRKMDTDPTITSSEKGFRSFMKVLNFRGGGVVFEAMNEAQIDSFMDECAYEAASL